MFNVRNWIFWLTVVALMACGRVEDEEKSSDLDGSGGSIISSVLEGVKEFFLTQDPIDGVLIGDALPNVKNALKEVVGGKDTKAEFKKTATSIIGAELFAVKYQISFRYGSNYLGKGAYIENVVFLPLETSMDPTIKMTVKLVTEKPVNLGDSAAPIAGLKFNIIWTLDSKIAGAKSKTDSFELNGKSGKLKSDIRDFD